MFIRWIVLAATMVLLVLPATRAQQPADRATVRPPRDAHLEQKRDPYRAIPDELRLRSPGMVVERNGYISVQVNVDENGNNIVGDAANEPSLAVDPTNPTRMAIGWRQFDSVLSDFRQAGFGYTTDGGLSWTFPGVIEPGVFRSDPVVDSDGDGVFYYNSLTNEGGYQCKLFRSYDGGATWDSGTFAYGGDKQWQVIDKSGGVGDGHIYACWNLFYSICSGDFTRSVDGGDSFQSCLNMPGSPIWGTLAIGPDGELYISGEGFLVVKSSNAKYADQSLQWDFSQTVDLGGSVGFGGGPNPGGLLGQTWIDVDTSGGPYHGYVYMLCSVDPPGPDPLDVHFARSTNGGLTWSTPVRVNDDVGNSAWQWFGTLSVAPNGRIDVAWLDTREDPGGYDSALYYSYSVDGGETWMPNEALSPSFDPHVGWPQQNKMGDYFDMTSEAYGAHLAWAGTFNGEQDVYYTYITQTIVLTFPEGLPSLITPHQPTAIALQILPGSESYVWGTGKMYYRFDDGEFTSVPFQPTGPGGSFRATLPPASCDADVQFYFSAEGSESGVRLMPPGAPENVFTTEVGSFVPFYENYLDADPGWTAQVQWAFGVPTGQGGAPGGPDPTSGYTGDYVCGYNLDGNYTPNLPERHLTSSPIDCTGREGVHLKFRRWLGVDEAPDDRAFVRVSHNGTNWVTVWQNDAKVEDLDWQLMDLDISAIADNQPAVQLRWTMGPTDGFWNYCGWNIDDVILTEVTCVDPFGPGDLNCDQLVDFRDINPFVLALANAAAYASAYPDCDRMLADVNGDGVVDFRDINPFVLLLAGG